MEDTLKKVNNLIDSLIEEYEALRDINIKAKDYVYVSYNDGKVAVLIDLKYRLMDLEKEVK